MNILVKIPVQLEVLQPTKPVLVNPYAESDMSVFVVSQQEIDLMKSMDREGFIHSFPFIKYFQLDRSSTQVHSLYKESAKPVFKEPVLVPIMVRLNPTIWTLKKYGIETEQDAIAVISCSWLEEYAPTFTSTAGDRLEYNGILFEVLTSKLFDFFANTQVPLHRLLTLKNLPS